MIFPRSIQQAAVLLVDLIAWPVGKAIDKASFLNLTKDDDE